jgi:effector-binding domain-containing protein
MRYNVESKPVEPIITGVIRSQVPRHELARFVPAACGEVWSFFRSAGLRKPGRHVALYLPDGFVEVGVEVFEPFTGNQRVVCSQLPGGVVEATTHFGPYQRLGDAHAAVREWCQHEGRALNGVCWEIYGHWEESWNSDPSKIRTDVFHLLK